MSIFLKTFSALITSRGGASSRAEYTVYGYSYSYMTICTVLILFVRNFVMFVVCKEMKNKGKTFMFTFKPRFHYNRDYF